MYEGLKDDSKRIQVFNLTMNEMINKVKDVEEILSHKEQNYGVDAKT